MGEELQDEPGPVDVATITSPELAPLSAEAKALNNKLLEMFDQPGHPNKIVEALFRGVDGSVDVAQYASYLFKIIPLTVDAMEYPIKHGTHNSHRMHESRHARANHA